jgi:hypothetical protein
MAPTYPRRNAIERDQAGEPYVLVEVDGTKYRVWFEGGEPVWVANHGRIGEFEGYGVDCVGPETGHARAADAAVRFINAIKGECA